MSKSESCLDQTDVKQGVGIQGKTERRDVKERRQCQTKQSYGDVLSPQCPRAVGNLWDQTKGSCTMSTDLTSKDTHPTPVNEELSMTPDQSTDAVISVVDKITRSENVEISIVKTLVPTKEPTSRPSLGYTRPQCEPCAILVNGKWINLNKRPCVLVRLRERMARVFHRLNRWYDEVMFDFVMIRARRQADKRREEGLRQRNV